jgi:uncharacterized RDD family membrane protein YckC
MAEHETKPVPSRKCARCGAEIPANLPPDLCPACLLQAALPTQAGPAKTVRIADLPAPAESRGLPQPGDQLGHYRIVRLLGEGGMGAVFDAEDLESGRRVALKVLSQKLDSPEARERFFREGRLAASINHPNSVYVFGTEEIVGIPVIAMELVAGGTLQDRVLKQGPLPVGEAVDCALQIIAGLEAARRIGILHRDIKPSNCFMDADGTVKIGDFGLSISTTVRTEPALTATGAFLGTPAFCSPEQLRGDELNVRSDMYSVGATLFYLLTGRTPFEGKNTVQLLATVLEKRAPSPQKFRPGIPQGLANAVLRCLEKQSGDRFKNYHELELALAPYGSAAPSPATLGLRFVAGLLDQIFLCAVGVSLLLLSGRNFMDFLNLAGKGSSQALGMVLTHVTMAVLYYSLFEGIWGAALGKTICRLRIVGPNRNVPGIARAFLRALFYVVTPMLPFWLFYGFNPKAYFTLPHALQYVLSASVYIVLGLFFCMARRRNGFASLYDLLTKTRVISRAALESRPELAAQELPPPTVEGGPSVGPYYILETLEKSAGTQWLLGYDLRLLRKVWLRVVPSGTPPVPASLRNIGRVGRLRWLAGRRSAEENWDAFEAASGKPLLALVQERQLWSRVRYWLYDLAREISVASRDGTLPTTLSLNRVWITDDGRAKLLDFPVPGFTSGAASDESIVQPCHFLSEVARVALLGRADAIPGAAGRWLVPLPLHVRDFLDRLPEFPDTDTVAGALKPLLQRVAAVSRWRRAAIVAGCLVGPLFAAFSVIFGAFMFEQWNKTNPGLLDLCTLLQQRTTMNSSRWLKDKPHPSDQQFAIYIASHYRAVVTNETVWTGALAMSMISGEPRRFAEQSLAEHPAPTAAEIKDADAALKGPQDLAKAFDLTKRPWFPFFMAGTALIIYVCIPSLIAALLFRGGLVLLLARVTFVRADGTPASRLRVFWRALVAWSPVLGGLILMACLKPWLSLFAASAVAFLIVGCLAAISVTLPERGLQDRFAGTWPVPR